MLNNIIEERKMKDYVAPEIEVVEVMVEYGYVYTSADAFGGDGTVITPEF